MSIYMGIQPEPSLSLACLVLAWSLASLEPWESHGSLPVKCQAGYSLSYIQPGVS